MRIYTTLTTRPVVTWGVRLADKATSGNCQVLQAYIICLDISCHLGDNQNEGF